MHCSMQFVHCILLSRTYLAHHELESEFIIVIIIITIIITTTIIIITTITITVAIYHYCTVHESTAK